MRIPNDSVFNSSSLPNISYNVVVLAVHNPQKNILYTILAPFNKRAAVKSEWMVDPSPVGEQLKVGQLVYFCVPLEKKEEKDEDHMRLDADKFT